MVAAGEGSTPTDVNTQTNLDMAASATAATDELSKNATRKSLDFVGGIVSRRSAGLDTTAGAATTIALSNAASAWVHQGASQNATLNNSVDRRTAVLGLADDRPCLSNCSGRGICEMGECLCDTYLCLLGHCIRVPFERDPAVAYVAEDECTNATCFRYECARGMCKPGAASCVEGTCSHALDGGVECYRGSCTAHLGYYAQPDCARTPEAKAASELQQRRDDKGTATVLSGAVRGLSSAVLADRVVGENSVDFDTDMIKSTSLRASPTALSSSAGFSTPGTNGAARRPAWAVTEARIPPCNV